MATRQMLAEVVVRYRDKTGVDVQVESTGAVNAVKRVEAGEVFDGVLLSFNGLDTLMAAGKVVGPRIDFVHSGVAIAVKAGAPHPDVASEEAVKRAVLAAPSLSYSTGASGIALAKLFERWGIAEQIQSRIVVPPPGTPVGTLLAKGDVALGFQQLSELKFLAGIDIVGPLPPAIQIDTLFSAGVAATCTQREATEAFFAFLNDPSLDQLKVEQGFAPM